MRDIQRLNGIYLKSYVKRRHMQLPIKQIRISLWRCQWNTLGRGRSKIGRCQTNVENENHGGLAGTKKHWNSIDLSLLPIFPLISFGWLLHDVCQAFFVFSLKDNHHFLVVQYLSKGKGVLASTKHLVCFSVCLFSIFLAC
ncbi:hypothetical protein QBC43DRAFT_319499 [Cladorrhinum sp. PSN259]|nr:hypothetical protein QBC43DRAFT_319499 [Cladorrhinum sp. PSN259]